MNTRLTLWRAVRVLTAGLGVLVVSSAAASDKGWAAAEQVNEDSYRYFMNKELYTHVGDDRGLWLLYDHDVVRDNIGQKFEDYGLAVEYDDFQVGIRQGCNVVATMTGSAPGEYLISAHYDSYDPFAHPLRKYPGADDDASGVAALLEAARILSQYESLYTIRFIAFDWHEIHFLDGYLKGSEHYVEQHAADPILGMISLDMIAHDPDETNHARVFGRKDWHALKNALGAAITEYGCGLTCTICGEGAVSDQMSFEDIKPACCLHEGEDNDDFRHTENDSYEQAGNLNFEYAVKMTRSVVGYLVDAAGVDVDVNTLKFTYPNGRPTFTDPQGGTRMRVEVTGVGNVVPQPGTGQFGWQVGNLAGIGPMDEISPNVYEAEFPGAECGDEIFYSVSAEDVDANLYTDPRDCSPVSYSATAGYGRRLIKGWDFDDNPFWACDPLWEWGQPLGLGGEHGPPDPTEGYTGTTVYGYNLHGDYDNDLAEKHLTSEVIDCTGKYAVHLSFWRWLGVEAPFFDQASVSVSADGFTWNTVWENVGEVGDAGWQPVELDISDVADNEPAVRLRWTMGPTDDSWRYCGWNIDDVEIWSVFPAPGDVDVDGDVDLADLSALLTAYGTCVGDPNYNPDADFDADDCITLADLAALLTNYGVVCP